MAVAEKSTLCRAGFASCDLATAFDPALEPVDELRVQVCALAPHGEAPVFLCGSDISIMCPQVACRLSSAIARRIGTPSERVAIFTTQNHGAPFLTADLHPPGLEEAFATAAEEAMSVAEPAWCCAVSLTPEIPGHICRRLKVSGFGALTFWYGQRKCGDGAVDGGALAAEALSRLAAGEQIVPKCPAPSDFQNQGGGVLPQLPGPMHFDRPADRCLQAVFFRDAARRPLGSIVRWAAHPALATGLTGKPGGDYPVYLRRLMAEALGAEHLFLTGPCGDQAVAAPRKSAGLARETGERLAGELLEALPGAEWEPLEVVESAVESLRMPLRTDVPPDADACAEAESEALRNMKTHRDRSGSVEKLKALADRVETLRYWTKGSIQHWTGLDYVDLERGYVEHPCFALRLNGNLILGLPGEPFGAYSTQLRRSLAGVNCIVAEECNGYLCYLPMSADFRDGGYEVCASPFGPDAEAAVLQGMHRLAERLFRADSLNADH